MAKGVFRPKSRLAGVLDSLHLCEIQFSPARAGDLHSLREATLLEAFVNVRKDYPRLSLAAYGVELIERSTEAEFPMPELFDLLQRLLRFLDANAGSQKALRHFESELVRLLGVAQPGIPAEESLEALLHRLPANRVSWRKTGASLVRELLHSPSRIRKPSLQNAPAASRARRRPSVGIGMTGLG